MRPSAANAASSQCTAGARGAAATRQPQPPLLSELASGVGTLRQSSLEPTQPASEGSSFASHSGSRLEAPRAEHRAALSSAAG